MAATLSLHCWPNQKKCFFPLFYIYIENQFHSKVLWQEPNRRVGQQTLYWHYQVIKGYHCLPCRWNKMNHFQQAKIIFVLQFCHFFFLLHGEILKQVPLVLQLLYISECPGLTFWIQGLSFLLLTSQEHLLVFLASE